MRKNFFSYKFLRFQKITNEKQNEEQNPEVIKMAMMLLQHFLKWGHAEFSRIHVKESGSGLGFGRKCNRLKCLSD